MSGFDDRRTFLKRAARSAWIGGLALRSRVAEAQGVVTNSMGTEPPRFKAPANACDSHMHIYDAARYQREPSRVVDVDVGVAGVCWGFEPGRLGAGGVRDDSLSLRDARSERQTPDPCRKRRPLEESPAVVAAAHRPESIAMGAVGLLRRCKQPCGHDRRTRDDQRPANRGLRRTC